jgi:hypothetical protein
MSKKPIKIIGPCETYPVVQEIQKLWGSFSYFGGANRRIKGDHFSAILHLIAMFGYLDSKLIYSLFTPKIRHGIRRLCMVQKNKKFILTPEGVKIEKALAALEIEILQHQTFEGLSFNGQILYLLVFPKTAKEYDLFGYFQQLSPNSDRFMLSFFICPEYLPLLLCSRNPGEIRVAQFRLEVERHKKETKDDRQS